jgi:hypothetical protein
MQLISTNVLLPAISPGGSTNVLAKSLAQKRGGVNRYLYSSDSGSTNVLAPHGTTKSSCCQ